MKFRDVQIPSGMIAIAVAVLSLGVILVALKLCHLTDMSWALATFPFWGPAVAVGALALGILAVIAFGSISTRLTK